MMDPLGMLVILFIGMSVISILALLLLLLLKDEQKKRYVVYFLGIWGMVIAWVNVSSLPETFMGEIVRALILGALGAAAILLQFCGKKKSLVITARILAVISVIAGLIAAFLL